MPSVEHVALGKQPVTVNSRPGRLVLPSVKGGALGKKVFFVWFCRVLKWGTRQMVFFSRDIHGHVDTQFVCRVSFTECYTRHNLRRVYKDLCQVFLTLSKPHVSRSRYH